jgi:hypothetical protein
MTNPIKAPSWAPWTEGPDEMRAILRVACAYLPLSQERLKLTFWKALVRNLSWLAMGGKTVLA